MQSLLRLPSAEISFVLSVELNGPAEGSEDQIISCFAQLASIRLIQRLLVRRHDTAGKISAVNFAMEEAQHSLGLIVIDDDIIIPPNAISDMTGYLSCRRQHNQALCFPKTTVDYLAPTRTFAWHHQFLLHPTVQRYLLDISVFESRRRPCGSLYAIHRDHLRLFPNPCNEADVFRDRRFILSAHYVRTWYPQTFEEEVARRRRHIESDTQNATNANPFNGMQTLEHDTFRNGTRLPNSAYARVIDALVTLRSVFQEAEGG